MTPANFIKFSFIFCLFNLTACTETFVPVNEMEEIKEYPAVDQELWPYFTRFEIAAAERGIQIDLNAAGIVGKLRKIMDSQAVGLCYHNPTQPNELIIDSSYWKRVSNSRRELIVFHELGHCFLSRNHHDEVTDDGVCASLMRSGTKSCLDFYNGDTRDGLLDELFRDF